MTTLDHGSEPSPLSRPEKVLCWVTGLTALATMMAVPVLVLTGNVDLVAAALGVGTTATTARAAVDIRIRIRR
ncbi:hypothetical protein ACFW1A_14215 [Kitasatospora sp. NPDC058965]|uniref:hypothetical protein n=1 Tax=Kitasatospora sp. NPDC058965 TaxID=3346682 RepID=UPI0036A81DAF